MTGGNETGTERQKHEVQKKREGAEPGVLYAFFEEKKVYQT